MGQGEALGWREDREGTEGEGVQGKGLGKSWDGLGRVETG